MLIPNRPPSARPFLAVALACVALLPASATAVGVRQPLQFFNGRTELVSTVKVFARKAYNSRTLGNGQILPDGSLALVQQIYDEGQSPQQRKWRIRRLGPTHFGGTMSDAVGPVVVDEVGGRYRFKFRMKGSLTVEQWLTPIAGQDAAKSTVTVRKFGFRVATSTGIIRRI
jgi:hypothetical protein